MDQVRILYVWVTKVCNHVYITLGGPKAPRLETCKKISDFFSHQSSPPYSRSSKAVEVQTLLTTAALVKLEGKASNSDRIETLEQVRLAM